MEIKARHSDRGLSPSTWEAEAGGSQFQDNLVYIGSSRTAEDTQRNKNKSFVHFIALWNLILQSLVPQSREEWLTPEAL